jgi:hypothetical protein
VGEAHSFREEQSMNQTSSIDKTDRSPVDSVLQTLDLLHPPLPERDTTRLTSLSITDLEQVYHTLSTTPASPDWQDFAWDTFTEMIERELALEG